MLNYSDVSFLFLRKAYYLIINNNLSLYISQSAYRIFCLPMSETKHFFSKKKPIAPLPPPPPPSSQMDINGHISHDYSWETKHIFIEVPNVSMVIITSVLANFLVLYEFSGHMELKYPYNNNL